MTDTHKKYARFIKPPNILKEKVGSGGLSKNILEKAQQLLDENSIDFEPIAQQYMGALQVALNEAEQKGGKDQDETLLENMIKPIMQMKANGGMFKYTLVSRISDGIVLFLEHLDRIDADVLEILQAYQTTITAILHGRIQGDGGEKGDALAMAISDACARYNKKQNI